MNAVNIKSYREPKSNRFQLTREQCSLFLGWPS